MTDLQDEVPQGEIQGAYKLCRLATHANRIYLTHIVANHEIICNSSYGPFYHVNEIGKENPLCARCVDKYWRSIQNGIAGIALWRKLPKEVIKGLE